MSFRFKSRSHHITIRQILANCFILFVLLLFGFGQLLCWLKASCLFASSSSEKVENSSSELDIC